MLKCLVFLYSLSLLPFPFLCVNRDDFRFMADHTHAHLSHTCTHTFAYLINAFLPFRPFDLLSLRDFHWFSIIFNWQDLSEVLTSSPPSHAQLCLSTDCMAEEFNKFPWLLSSLPRLLLIPCALAIPASCLYLLPRIIYASIVISCFHFLCSACLCIGMDLSFLELGKVRSFIYSLIAIRQWPLAKSLYIC